MTALLEYINLFIKVGFFNQSKICAARPCLLSRKSKFLRNLSLISICSITYSKTLVQHEFQHDFKVYNLSLQP